MLVLKGSTLHIHTSMRLFFGTSSVWKYRNSELKRLARRKPCLENEFCIAEHFPRGALSWNSNSSGGNSPRFFYPFKAFSWCAVVMATKWIFLGMWPPRLCCCLSPPRFSTFLTGAVSSFQDASRDFVTSTPSGFLVLPENTTARALAANLCTYVPALPMLRSVGIVPFNLHIMNAGASINFSM